MHKKEQKKGNWKREKNEENGQKCTKMALQQRLRNLSHSCTYIVRENFFGRCNVRKLREQERELAKELLREKFHIYDYHTEVQKWIIDRLERYTYNNYKYYARKMSYIKYITQLYKNNRGIKVVRKKYFQLLKDLKRTQEKLYERKNIVVKEGTRAWAALHLPPPSMPSPRKLRDEIGVATPIWDDVYVSRHIKVLYIKKLI